MAMNVLDIIASFPTVADVGNIRSFALQSTLVRLSADSSELTFPPGKASGVNKGDGTAASDEM